MGDFQLETKLLTENRNLHQRTKDSAVVLQKMLESFIPRFPDFTDHTILHSMDVLEYSNMLLGEEQIERLSPAECYVLIMSCYLHDIGMGISQKNYEELSKQIDFGDYFETHSREDTDAIIRAFHNEYSGLFIRKYAELFDIPCEEMVFAIVQVSRGHRKTDLTDEKEYPESKIQKIYMTCSWLRIAAFFAVVEFGVLYYYLIDDSIGIDLAAIGAICSLFAFPTKNGVEHETGFY